MREEIKQIRSDNTSLGSLLEPAAIDEILKLITTSNKALLQDVREALPKKWGPNNNGAEGSIMWSQALGHDKALEGCHQAIDQVAKERGLV